MFGTILKAARVAGGAIANVGRAANKVPMLKAVPGVGNALALAGGVATVSSMVGGRGRNLPALPSGGAGLPALPMAPGMGSRGIFSNDANVPDAIKPFVVSKGDLKFYPRAPKGFVIVYDEKGDPFAVPKKIAQMMKWWKPAKRPPISVGDWQAVRKADRTIKKMRKIFRMTATVDKGTSGGKVVVRRRKKVA